MKRSKLITLSIAIVFIFEHTLMLLDRINPTWMKKATPKYESLLNLWRKEKNVHFCTINMKFVVKG